MRILSSLLLLLAFASTSASAETVRYELNVYDFHELKVVDGINVVYACNPDSAGVAVFECPPDITSAFIFNNKNGRLIMQLATETVRRAGMPTVKVYSKYLDRVENSGDSLVKVLSVKDCPKFTAKLVGNGRLSVRDINATEVNAQLKTGHGTLTVSGHCEKAAISLVGTGVIQADELEAQEVSLKASGTGSVGLWAVKQLSVGGIGSTSVYYKGEPTIKNRAIGLTVSRLVQ